MFAWDSRGGDEMSSTKTVKVRFRVPIASPTWSYELGQVAEIPAADAKAWTRSGVVEVVDDDVPLGLPPATMECSLCGEYADGRTGTLCAMHFVQAQRGRGLR